MKNTIEYLDKIVNILEKPYFYELKNYGINLIDDMDYIFKKIYGFDVIIFLTSIENQDGKQIYFEYKDDWVIFEYDSNGNLIYTINSYGEIIDNKSLF